ncbi:MAG: DUF4297 domain-containing protein [Acetobacteraceae bacterium]|nr:DUF4297 domain-containing protein [Acetobacteraceae bacterium]
MVVSFEGPLPGGARQSRRGTPSVSAARFNHGGIRAVCNERQRTSSPRSHMAMRRVTAASPTSPAVSVLKLIEHHEAEHPYRAFFDHIDDLIFHNDGENPTSVSLFQIKGWDGQKCNAAALLANSRDDPLPRTIPGKLYWGVLLFGVKAVTCAGILTNAPLKFGLAAGGSTSTDHAVVTGLDMHDGVWTRIHDAMRADHPGATVHNCRTIFRIERVPIEVRGHREQIIMRLYRTMEALGATPDNSPMWATATALLAEVSGKIGVTREFSDASTLYREKSISRSELERFLRRAVDAPNFNRAWPTIEARLREKRIPDRQIIRLQNSCLAYIRARLNGEPAATDFRSRARAHLQANAEEYLRYDTILDAADLLNSIDYQVPLSLGPSVDHDAAARGARIVEAYEAEAWLSQTPPGSSGLPGT